MNWFEEVIGAWLASMDKLQVPTEAVERARTFVDGEYDNDFEYPDDYKAMRAFFMHCMADRRRAGGDDLWADPLYIAVVAAERGYRMGFEDGQKKGKESPSGEKPNP